jgi:hypothetical protein
MIVKGEIYPVFRTADFVSCNTTALKEPKSHRQVAKNAKESKKIQAQNFETLDPNLKILAPFGSLRFKKTFSGESRHATRNTQYVLRTAYFAL